MYDLCVFPVHRMPFYKHLQFEFSMKFYNEGCFQAGDQHDRLTASNHKTDWN